MKGETMTRMKWIVLGTLLLAAALPAWAQDGSGTAGERPGAGRMMERVRMLWMWRMTEEVQLNDEEAAKLFPLVQEYEQKVRAARRSQVDLLKELKGAQESGKALSKDEILDLYDRSIRADGEVHKIRREELVAVSKVLSDEKFQKYVVAQFKFRREMMEMVRGARRGRGGPGGAQAPGGPWDSPDAEDMR
jgi:hypothetical protein